HIARGRHGAETCGVLLELLGAPGKEDDVRSLLSQCLGAREAEAGRGAADERGAPAQSEIHDPPGAPGARELRRASPALPALPATGSCPELATTRVVMPPRAANSPSTSTK